MHNSLLNSGLATSYPHHPAAAADGLRLWHAQQSSSRQIQIRQRTNHKQTQCVLYQPRETRLGKVKLAVDHAMSVRVQALTSPAWRISCEASPPATTSAE
jgi:hypothetical protein